MDWSGIKCKGNSVEESYQAKVFTTARAHMPCVRWTSKASPEIVPIMRNKAFVVVAMKNVSMHNEGDTVVRVGLKVDDKGDAWDEKA